MIELKVDDDVLVDRIAGRYTCARCGTGYHDTKHPPKVAGVCDKCGSPSSSGGPTTMPRRCARACRPITSRPRRSIGYYQAKGLLASVDGMADIDEVTDGDRRDVLERGRRAKKSRAVDWAALLDYSGPSPNQAEA